MFLGRPLWAIVMSYTLSYEIWQQNFSEFCNLDIQCRHSRGRVRIGTIGSLNHLDDHPLDAFRQARPTPDHDYEIGRDLALKRREKRKNFVPDNCACHLGVRKSSIRRGLRASLIGGTT